MPAVLPPALASLLTACDGDLQRLRQQGLGRSFTVVDAVDGPRVVIDGRSLICWCSNDYLGLSGHSRVQQAAIAAAQAYGVGARASRLLAGTTRWHERLEETLAEWFNAESAIVYSSGYLANVGTLGALLDARDVVFVDRLAHASLVEAARSSRARLRVFHHNDVEHLHAVLAKGANARRRVIITEGVFSMEGDLAPLKDLLRVAEFHGAIVYLDDAHGAFVLGAEGRGTPEALGASHECMIYMGTLGKALGCQGGFIVGPSALTGVLRNRSKTFIYDTAPSPSLAASAHEALGVLREEPWRREAVRRQARTLTRQLFRGTESPQTHVISIVLGSPERAMAVSRRLWEQGHWAPAIRPPTVSRGTARLRLGVTALHTDEQIGSLLDSLARVSPS